MGKRADDPALTAFVEGLLRERGSVTVITMIVAAKRAGLLDTEMPTATARIRIHIAIRNVRKRLVDDVVICSGNRFRFATNAAEAEVWRRKRCAKIMTQIDNVNVYAAAEAHRFGEGEEQSEAWSMAHESLRRAQADVERAARMSFG